MPAYPAARLVADRVQAHFARHMAQARSRKREAVAPEPDARAIETIIDAAFWASLRREEGLTPKISLAWLPPDATSQPLTFAHRLALEAATLAKVAPAVERPGIHLGVWHDGESISVWGTTRVLPAACFVLEVVASGLLVVKERSDSFGKFINVVVLAGDQVKFVDERNGRMPDCPNLLKSLLGADVSASGEDTVNVLVQVAASMRAHGRGGTLLVVPGGSTHWRDSIVSPAPYAVDPPFEGLAEVMHREGVDRAHHEWQEDLRRSVEAIAGLTAVDGATILSDRFELLAFGAKITRRRGNVPVDRVLLSEPVDGSVATETAPALLGGTRHLSAAQFVQDQRDATALVASQDGGFTIFQWSEAESVVHAYRVDVLLL
jgi:hypothetical protein